MYRHTFYLEGHIVKHAAGSVNFGLGIPLSQRTMKSFGYLNNYKLACYDNSVCLYTIKVSRAHFSHEKLAFLSSPFCTISDAS